MSQTLAQRIQSGMVEAMKAKDETRTETLRLIRAAMKNAEIDRRPSGATGALADADVVAVLQKMRKQMQDSIEQFRSGGRADLAEKEVAQLKIVEQFLPQALSTAEVESLVVAMIAETGASSMKDMGKVVKAVMAKAEGRADGKQVSELVKAKLGG